MSKFGGECGTAINGWTEPAGNPKTAAAHRRLSVGERGVPTVRWSDEIPATSGIGIAGLVSTPRKYRN